MSAPVDVEARKLADLLIAMLKDAGISPLFLATVATVTAGGASDGNALVQYARFGANYNANGYLNSYTPAVNDRVLGVYADSQPILLGKVIGKP